MRYFLWCAEQSRRSHRKIDLLGLVPYAAHLRKTHIAVCLDQAAAALGELDQIVHGQATCCA